MQASSRRTQLHSLRALPLLFALPVTALAQQPGEGAKQLPQFEVATIKPIDPSPGVMHRIRTDVYPEGRIRITTRSLKSLICMAFQLTDFQVAGGEEWMDKEKFDVEGKAPVSSPPVQYDVRHTNLDLADPRLREMLQALLIERFHVKYHIETRTGPVYLLEKSGKSTPLKPSQEAYAKAFGNGWGDVGAAGDHWNLYNTSMSQLAAVASQVLRKPVLDRTGMEGAFDYRWTIPAPDDPSQTRNFLDSFPDFIDAMGMKLTKSTGPIETLVIDHAERPSAN